MTIWSEVVEVNLLWTDRLTPLSLLTNSSAVGSHDCAQLSALKEHHSTCQHLSPPNTSPPMWFYNISKVQSNFYISSHRGETPEGTSVSWNAASPSPSITIRKKVPSDCLALPAIILFLLSFNVGTCPNTNEDWLVWFFSADVAFFPPLCHIVSAAS